MGLLDGVRVLEFGVLLNADSAGMRLADHGADVIKVESPPMGDYLRDINGTIAPRASVMHTQANKNKRSVAINMRDPAGVAVFWRLLATADVFLDGFLAGATDRLGIGYEEQKARKPDIVYCSYTGYGASGPYARIPTHGQMMDALGAEMHRQMSADGQLEPVPVHGLVGTMAGGEGTSAGSMHAALAILAGLVHRDRTKEGCYIDVAASDAVVSQAWINAATELNGHRVTSAEPPPPVENGAMIGAKYQFYQCADGTNILFCAIEHKFWDGFCEVADREDLKAYKDMSTPIDYGLEPELRPEVQKVFHTRTRAEWIEIAREHKLPIGPAPQSLAEMRQDPHVQHRGLIFEAVDPLAGDFSYIGNVPIVRDHPYELRHPAPEFGAHTRTILGDELGLGEAELEALLAQGAVVG